MQRLPVYTQDVIDLTAQARELLAATNPIILPVFSPRSAQVLSHQVQGARAPLWLAAISDASLALAPCTIRSWQIGQMPPRCATPPQTLYAFSKSASSLTAGFQADVQYQQNGRKMARRSTDTRRSDPWMLALSKKLAFRN
ncbi:MAG: hypothetical protein U5N55_06855 [Cypionkella sp.]|nr:hypothetical protein [Cypionkella sp.]